MSFVHLHVHSHYSLLDGLPKIKELVKKAKDFGMPALALTDHGVMYGTLEFYQECLKQGIKPILGLETYLAPTDLHFKKTKVDDQTAHLTLLAKNLTGYKNLMHLSTVAHLDGFYYKPRIDKKILAERKEGLIILSGCLKGEIMQALVAGDFKKAMKLAAEYRELFGDDFYLELQVNIRPGSPDFLKQQKANELMVKLSLNTGIPLVATHDIHYINPEDAEAQDVLVCVATGKTISDIERLDMRGADLSFLSPQAMAEKFKDMPAEALTNTLKIAAACDLTLDLGKWMFPQFALPKNETAESYLKLQAYQGLEKRLGDLKPEVKERLDYELNIINSKGYSPYFLIVADFVNWSRAQGIFVTTRGSAAGSLVAYALGITTLNPLNFKLPFERFLNPYRPSPPDIDVDFADNRRDEAIAYITERYGFDKVARIVTFGTMLARGSVRDVTRVLGLPYTYGDKISKLIPLGSQGFPMTIERALEVTPELKSLYESEADAKKIIDLSRRVEGCARHASVHAAGVVISPTILTDYVPLQKEPAGGDHIITQYDMHACEAAGLLKMDILGIRNLTILGEAVKIIEKTTGDQVDLMNLPFDDKKTYQLLAHGDTMGVFQLGGSGMTRYLKELKPSNIFDIMAMIALFRPGPMISIPEFIKRKHKPSLIKYFDPRMEDYLKESYGIITYQDDVLLTAINIAGYSWEEADKFRKAVGKKIPGEMIAQRERFILGCTNNGMSREKAEDLFKLIEPFSGYGFNKAHAASYAIVAYQTAYLKSHYPSQYMAAVMTAESNDLDKVAECFKECERMKIKVLPPDVNYSLANFTYINDNEIRFGLKAIKNLGNDIIAVIMAERKANGLFQSLEDFLTRVKTKNLNKKSLEALIKSGALDGLGERNNILGNLDKILNFVRASQKEENQGQKSLFAQLPQTFSLKLEPLPPLSLKQKLAWEKEYLGLYVSGHPFAAHEKNVAGYVNTISSLQNFETKGQVWVAGTVNRIQKIFTKSQAQMMFVTIEDTTGSIELLIFPKILADTVSLWQEEESVLVQGDVSDKDGVAKILVNKVHLLNQDSLMRIKELTNNNRPEVKVQNQAVKGIKIYLTKDKAKEIGAPLKEILMANNGETPVYLVYVNGGPDQLIATKIKINYTKEVIEKIQTLVGSGVVKVII